MQGITSSRFRMTPIFSISVRTASTHTGTYTARNLHSKITAISKGTCHKSQRTSSAKFCCVPCPSASAHAINLPYSYRCQSRPSRKQYKFTLQLNAALLKGRMHMHKHILCTHSSPQPVCSTSTQGHKDLALGEHYQSCNKVQGELTAAGDRAKPSPGNINSTVICLAQSALCSSKHGALPTGDEKG